MSGQCLTPFGAAVARCTKQNTGGTMTCMTDATVLGNRKREIYGGPYGVNG